MPKSIIICRGCGQKKELQGRGLCLPCYQKQWISYMIICKSCGRERPHNAKGLCNGCYNRINHYGAIKRYNAMKKYGIDLETMKKVTKSCTCCNFSKIVDLHHLSGNKKDNNTDNLIGLCPNCHRMIHTYEHYQEIVEILKLKGYHTENIHPTNYAEKRAQKGIWRKPYSKYENNV